MKRNIYGYVFRNAEPGSEAPATPVTTAEAPTAQPSTQPVPTESTNGQPINIHLHNPAPTPSVIKEPTPSEPAKTSAPEPPSTPVVSADTLMTLAGVPDVIKPLIANQSIDQLATYLTSPAYKELVTKLAPTPAPAPQETPKPEAKGQEPPKGDSSTQPTYPKTFKEVNSSHLDLFKQLFTEI